MLFLKASLYKQHQLLKLAKNQAKAKQHPAAEFLLFENFALCYPRYHSKIIGDIIKNVQKQVPLFKWGYMINDIENEAENEK